MLKTSITQVPEDHWRSPGGKYRQKSRPVSAHLGCDPRSELAANRHPFDFEHTTIPPRSSACPYHAHSAQWEMYVFLSGEGIVRDDKNERHPVGAGDVVLFPPNEAHEVVNESDADLVMLIIADNPIGESCYYPDSEKWLVQTRQERKTMRGHPVD
ncbi:MAG: cupin domain-containing protein, partial [Opitutaceae bacterium]